jgi:AbiJ-like protein
MPQDPQARAPRGVSPSSTQAQQGLDDPALDRGTQRVARLGDGGAPHAVGPGRVGVDHRGEIAQPPATDLVKRHWVLLSPEWSFEPKDPYEPVVRHMFRFPGDWMTVEFFKAIGVLNGGDRRFALFLEGLLSGSVNPREARQREMAAAISPILARAGLKITESGSSDGYPAFTIVAAGNRPCPAQLILFASRHGKPALRLRDVLDQSIEVLTGDDTVLAYDVPVSDRGLTWRDVESWWSHRKGISADRAKLELWRRLVTVCADVSPAQHALLVTYYDYAKDHDPLFALLPEVWLHWDPVSRRQRGEDAFLINAWTSRYCCLDSDGSCSTSMGNSITRPPLADRAPVSTARPPRRS